jgi:Bacteriocin-protection, YdeI or OmpD-Associated/Domain of unknown function (DUF1905)
MPKRHIFTAEVKAARGGGAFAEVPFDVETAFANQGVDPKRPTVKATIGGESFPTRLMKMGQPCHIVGIPKAVRDKLGKTYGDSIEIALEADATPREVVVPPDLLKALKACKPAQVFFDSLAFTHRKEYVGWITEAKKDETRARRITKALEMMLSGKRGV